MAPVKIVVTSGHMLVDVTDLPDGSTFLSKPYQSGAIASLLREIAAT
jgi:two-component system, response regulator PdtaR